jgi:hypothetical protein
MVFLPARFPTLASGERPLSAEAAAAQFVNGVTWRKESVAGDFSCRGKLERAILGTNKALIVVAIFLRGLDKPPEVLRYSASVRNAATAVLTVESMDFDPKEFERKVGHIPSGMRPSKTCKGLNMSDGEIDSAHIYWDHDAKRFSDWVL